MDLNLWSNYIRKKKKLSIKLSDELNQAYRQIKLNTIIIFDIEFIRLYRSVFLYS